jgi:hypothetical protein
MIDYSNRVVNLQQNYSKKGFGKRAAVEFSYPLPAIHTFIKSIWITTNRPTLSPTAKGTRNTMTCSTRKNKFHFSFSSPFLRVIQKINPCLRTENKPLIVAFVNEFFKKILTAKCRSYRRKNAIISPVQAKQKTANELTEFVDKF